MLYRLRKPLSVLAFLLIAPGSALAILQQPQSADEMALPGRLYIQFTEDNLQFAAGRTGLEAFDLKASRYQVTAIEKAFPHLDVMARNRPLAPSTEALRRVYVIHYNSGDRPRQVAADLDDAPEVRYAEPIYAASVAGFAQHGPHGQHDPGETQARPNDTYYSDQIYLPYLQLDRAWDFTRGQYGGTVIAIVAGGVDLLHGDLGANAWTNPGEIGGDGIDNDGNGFVDDLYGWNFKTGRPDPSGDLTSFHVQHGTAVTGIASAVTDNGKGIAGTSWNALFMAVGTGCPDSDNLCYHVEGVQYAAMNGADVISASFGTTVYSDTEKMAYQSATDEGALVVATSGGYISTSGRYVRRDIDVAPNYPASYPMVLSVGGIGRTSDDNRFNWGKTVNVFVPADSVAITFPRRSGGDVYHLQVSGGDFTAPMAAGIAAMVKSAFPSYGPHQIREQIRLTAVSIDYANHPSGKFGSGRVHAYEAVTAAGKPALRVTEWSYQNRYGGSEVGVTDTVEVKVSFINYLGTGSNLAAELTSDATFVEWVSSSQVALGYMDYGDTQEATYRFTLTDAAPKSGTLYLSPHITATGLSDSPDLLSIPFDRVFDHPVTLAASPSSVSEGAGATTITITAVTIRPLSFSQVLPIRVSASGVTEAVDFADVADFDITLPASSASVLASFTLTPTDDLVDEANEKITISSTSSQVSGPATLTLQDDDATPDITLSVRPMSIQEGDGSATITVRGTVTGGTTFGAAQSVDLTVTGSGNSGVVGFTPVTGVVLSIAAEAGSDSTTFTLTPTDNLTEEMDETITISSSNPRVSNTVTITLQDDDGMIMSLSTDPMVIGEGDGSTTITVTATSTVTFTDAQVLPITVTGSGLAEAVDYADVPGFDLALPVDSTRVTGTFTLTPIDDKVDEMDETLSITSSNTLVGGGSTVILQDNDIAPYGVSLSVAPDDIREDDGATTITVTATVSGTTLYAFEKVLNLTMTSTGVTGAVDYAPLPGLLYLTVPAEAASGIASFILTPENDEEGEADETITVSSDSSFVLSDATLVIRDDDGGRTSRDLEAEGKEFGVVPPYPNPASGQITFVLSSPEPIDWAHLRLYNMLGQEVAVPYEGTLRAGQHTVHYDGQHLPAGVYVYVLESRDTRITGQLIMAQ